MRLPSYSAPQLIWRSAVASPFALSVVLAVAVGPATINHRYGSFGWLIVISLIAAALMLTLPDVILIPTGVIAFLFFPPMAALAFYFAPAWAVPIAAIVFYGSMVASLASTVGAGVALARRRFRRRSRVVLAAATAIGLLGLVSACGPSSARAAGADTGAANMGPTINGSNRDAEPTFTAGGHTMYFNCNDYSICVSHLTGSWEAGKWGARQLLSAPINSQYMQVEPLINPAGDELYITSVRPYGSGEGLPGLGFYINTLYVINDMFIDQFGISLFNGLGHDKIWVSNLSNGSWSEPRLLDGSAGEPPIESAFNDHCVFISANGNEVFWTSDRPGGYGGNDIWTMRLVDGNWTKPENLGPNVNSKYGEHHSMLSPDGSSLYVTSDRPGGWGGEDIYLATRGADSTWGSLRDLPAPINGPGNDRCPVLTPDGQFFVFDSDRAGGSGSKDIWWLHWKDVPK